MSSPAPSARLLRASFAFTDARPLFEELDLVLTPGFTGLCGPNGAGKSTLLRILAGTLPPTAGRAAFAPEGASVRLCAQGVEALDDDVRWLGEDPPPRAHRLMGELGLFAAQVARWETLSPGERKRWQIAAALAREPDVLLLDEPTNHLDAGGRDWLLRALRRLRGVGVIVSHDRALLDALTSRTLWLEGALRDFPGPYGEARAAWDRDREAQVEAKALARARQHQARRSLQDARQTRAAAEENRSAGHRMKDRHDSDARTLGADFRAEQAEKRLARSQNALRRAEARAATAVTELRVEKPLGKDLFADHVPCPRPIVLRLVADGLRAGDSPLVSGPVRVYVGRADRIHLSGDNGAGKTTLLRALLAGCGDGSGSLEKDTGAAPLRGPLPAAGLPPPVPSQVLYLPQELAAPEVTAAMARLRALPRDARGRVLGFVAALGVDPDHLLATPAPSPGEARKLLLAEGLGRGVWALVLDEPTNHLDLPSVERLEALLAAWPGALVLVTHDARLASRSCTTRWTLAAGQLRTCT